MDNPYKVSMSEKKYTIKSVPALQAWITMYENGTKPVPEGYTLKQKVAEIEGIIEGLVLSDGYYPKPTPTREAQVLVDEDHNLADSETFSPSEMLDIAVVLREEMGDDVALRVLGALQA